VFLGRDGSHRDGGAIRCHSAISRKRRASRAAFGERKKEKDREGAMGNRKGRWEEEKERRRRRRAQNETNEQEQETKRRRNRRKGKRKRKRRDERTEERGKRGRGRGRGSWSRRGGEAVGTILYDGSMNEKL